METKSIKVYKDENDCLHYLRTVDNKYYQYAVVEQARDRHLTSDIVEAWENGMEDWPIFVKWEGVSDIICKFSEMKLWATYTGVVMCIYPERKISAKHFLADNIAARITSVVDGIIRTNTFGDDYVIGQELIDCVENVMSEFYEPNQKIFTRIATAAYVSICGETEIYFCEEYLTDSRCSNGRLKEFIYDLILQDVINGPE